MCQEAVGQSDSHWRDEHGKDVSPSHPARRAKPRPKPVVIVREYRNF